MIILTDTHPILRSGALQDDPLLEVGYNDCAFVHEPAEQNPGDPTLGIHSNPAALSTGRASRSRHHLRAQAHFPNSPFADHAHADVMGLDAFDQQGVLLKTALIESRRVLTNGDILLLRASTCPCL
ncbi:MAG: hypothetical protein QF660_01395 [Anaerolineales bacterium]|nr:hypothetical protein [Anaerolineales bacterium]